MLIKVYTCRGTIHIIENAKDVTIHDGAFDYNDRSNIDGWGPLHEELTHQVMFDLDPREQVTKKSPMAPETTLCKLIDFTGDAGERSRLVVFHLAYICNDTGKTIEKVTFNRPFIAENKNCDVAGNTVM